MPVVRRGYADESPLGIKDVMDLLAVLGRFPRLNEYMAQVTREEAAVGGVVFRECKFYLRS